MRCIKCGDLGKPGGCPKCGLDSNKYVIKEDKKERFISSCRFKAIPDDFIGRVWDNDVIMNSHPERSGDYKFKDFVGTLTRIVNMFSSGKILDKSLFISAPSRMGKTVFACTCMQYAQKNGYSVAPLLDTLELKRMLILGCESLKFKMYGWSYERYITSDVLFVTVTKTDYYSEALPILLELISRRSRMGKPTYIISKFNLKEISQDGNDRNYKQLVEQGSYTNDLKYPVILQIK